MDHVEVFFLSNGNFNGEKFVLCTHEPLRLSVILVF